MEIDFLQFLIVGVIFLIVGFKINVVTEKADYIRLGIILVGLTCLVIAAVFGDFGILILDLLKEYL